MKEQKAMIQSVDRAIQIMDLFTGSLEELGITEIAGMMGLGKSTVYGLVNTLLVNNYLEQNPENKRYRLGLKLFELGSIVQERMDVREIARPYLKKLSETFGMTVHMGIYKDWEVVYIDKVDAPNARILYSQVGKRAPMYCTGVGKAVLAYLKPADIKYILETQRREALTKYTKTDPGQILEDLEETRENGYSMDKEEVEIGLRCVAVPVFDYQSRPVAAVSISGAAPLIEGNRIEELSERLKITASEISKRLGYEG